MLSIIRALLLLSTLSLIASAMADTPLYYDIKYKARLDPHAGVAYVSISVEGKKLPRELILHLNPERHKDPQGNNLEVTGDKAYWRPKGKSSTIHYDFVVDHKRASGKYDSRITDEWAILRSDKLIPPISARGPKNLQSRATLEIDRPSKWNALTPYPKDGNGVFQLHDPGRRLIRPKGWMIAGRIGMRQDDIDGTDTVIAAPLGQNVRRQDALAFLGWTMPALKKVFPQFPQKLLIVMAGDPMWRGGLSGTRSLFMHADRPLISENRTSSMLHELIHVATGIRGDKESDWIVEGIAEYYSLEILRRTGGISERRYKNALDKLSNWGQKSPNLLVDRSAGPTTARAAVVLHQLDLEIQKSSDGKASLDDVVRALAEERGEVTLEKFRTLAEKSAGEPLPQLERAFLTGKKKP